MHLNNKSMDALKTEEKEARMVSQISRGQGWPNRRRTDDGSTGCRLVLSLLLWGGDLLFVDHGGEKPGPRRDKSIAATTLLKFEYVRIS